MKNQLRIYVAVQDNCPSCETTMEVIGKEVAGVPVYPVNLTSSPERRSKMGVSKTPTLFIVEGKDDDGDGIFEEVEEKHLFHQTGAVFNKNNLEVMIAVLKSGGKLATNLD